MLAYVEGIFSLHLVARTIHLTRLRVPEVSPSPHCRRALTILPGRRNLRQTPQDHRDRFHGRNIFLIRIAVFSASFIFDQFPGSAILPCITGNQWDGPACARFAFFYGGRKSRSAGAAEGMSIVCGRPEYVIVDRRYTDHSDRRDWRPSAVRSRDVHPWPADQEMRILGDDMMSARGTRTAPLQQWHRLRYVLRLMRY